MIHNSKIDNEMLLEYYRLKNLVRFNMNYKANNESVAEHSYFVVLFTMLISDMLVEKKRFQQVDVANCMRIATIHDLPEIEISDIPHPVKADNLALQEELSKQESKWVEENLPNYSNLFMSFEEPNSKLNLEYHYVVKMADILSVLQYAYLEIKMGNSTFEQILHDATKRYMDLKKKFEEHFGFDFDLFEKDLTIETHERWC